MFETSIRPRFCDTDALGHIGNTVVPVWFLEAREPLLALISPNRQFDKQALVVVRTEIDFKAEIEFGSDVELTTELGRIGNSSIVVLQNVIQQGKLCAQGTTTMVNFNSKTRKSSPISAELRATLSEHQRETE